MDRYDRETYKFEGGLGALYYELTDFARVIQYEHDEYFQSKKMGRHAPLRASGSKKNKCTQLQFIHALTAKCSD